MTGRYASGVEKLLLPFARLARRGGTISAVLPYPVSRVVRPNHTAVWIAVCLQALICWLSRSQGRSARSASARFVPISYVMNVEWPCASSCRVHTSNRRPASRPAGKEGLRLNRNWLIGDSLQKGTGVPSWTGLRCTLSNLGSEGQTLGNQTAARRLSRTYSSSHSRAVPCENF